MSYLCPTGTILGTGWDYRMNKTALSLIEFIGWVVSGVAKILEQERTISILGRCKSKAVGR